MKRHKPEWRYSNLLQIHASTDLLHPFFIILSNASSLRIHVLSKQRIPGQPLARLTLESGILYGANLARPPNRISSQSDADVRRGV